MTTPPLRLVRTASQPLSSGLLVRVWLGSTPVPYEQLLAEGVVDDLAAAEEYARSTVLAQQDPAPEFIWASAIPGGWDRSHQWMATGAAHYAVLTTGGRLSGWVEGSRPGGV